MAALDPSTGVSFRAEFRALVFVLFGIAWRAPWIGAAGAMREEGSPVRWYGLVDHLQPLPSSPCVWMHRLVSHPLPCNLRLHGVGLDGHEFSPLSPWTVACVRLTLYGQGSEHPSIPLLQPLAWDAHSTFFTTGWSGSHDLFLGIRPKDVFPRTFPFLFGSATRFKPGTFLLNRKVLPVPSGGSTGFGGWENARPPFPRLTFGLTLFRGEKGRIDPGSHVARWPCLSPPRA